MKDLFKKTNNDRFFIAAIVVTALVFLLPLFTPMFYVSHDGDAHVARFAAYVTAFQDGQFPPRWAGNLNFGYGTPIFIFYYPLPGYIASILHSVGLSLETIFKVLIALTFIAAPIGFFLWAKQLFKKEIAFVGALLYGLAPYHFLDLFVRGDVAELMALAFIPFAFLCIEKKKVVAGGFLYALSILSHNGISLMFSPVLALYGFLRAKNKKDILIVCQTLGLGLVLAAFFWLPALSESRYTNIHLFVGDMFKDHFPTPLELIYSSWGFGPDVRNEGGLSPQIGVLYVIFAFLSIFVIIKEKQKRKDIGWWLFVFFAAVFITLPLSTMVWNLLPLLRVYEFPWRFTALSSFAAVVLACYVLEYFKNKKLLIGVVLLLLVTSIPFVKVKEYVTYNDAYYFAHTGTTYYHGEASPIWVAGDPDKPAKQLVAFIAGDGKITNVQRKNHVHTFTVVASKSAKIVDNTTYFPGWKVSVDNEKVPIEFQDQNYRGLITFAVPEGKHTVKVEFTESPIRMLANTISVLGIVVLIVFLLIKSKKKRK